MTVAEIAAYMRLLLDSLAHIHRQGIIHRDVKPSNFLFAITPTEEYRRLMAEETTATEKEEAPLRHCHGLLVDFGLAQLQETDQTAPPTLSTRQRERVQNFAAYLARQPPGYIRCDTR